MPIRITAREVSADISLLTFENFVGFKRQPLFRVIGPHRHGTARRFSVFDRARFSELIDRAIDESTVNTILS
jgi:hypothetical protein